jgi:hypothetical protein
MDRSYIPRAERSMKAAIKRATITLRRQLLDLREMPWDDMDTVIDITTRHLTDLKLLAGVYDNARRRNEQMWGPRQEATTSVAAE